MSASDQNLTILYRDEDFIAIDKPADLLVHRSPIDKSETVFALQLLRDQIGQTVYPCHRLDRPTSGVLLFALHPDALRFAQKQFSQRNCTKKYLAVVRGWTPDAETIDYTLQSEEAPGKSWSALTHYHRLRQTELPFPSGRYRTTRLSLVELEPHTGRKHQLRRHMAHIRHPILGDTRHGDGAMNRFLRKHAPNHGLMLRATALTFCLLDSKTFVTVHASEETPFATALSKLRLSA